MSSLLKFKATLDQGKAQANQLNAQARQTELQGRVQAIEYQTEANNALSNLEKVLAANNARASAGNMDPLASGSSQDLIARLKMLRWLNRWQHTKRVSIALLHRTLRSFHKLKP